MIGGNAIPSILSQHAEEAAFQWLLRDLAVHAPHYDLKDLAKLDGRVEAHLDGLRIAGDSGWEVANEELSWEEPGEVFAASVLAFASGNTEWIAAVHEVIGESIELARGAISALGWIPSNQAEPHIAELLRREDPVSRRIAIGASAVHRKNPGPALSSAVESEDSVIRGRALKAVGELGHIDLLRACQAHLDSDDDSARVWAAWSAALLGDRAAAHTLTEIATAGGPRSETACDLASRSMPFADALAWHGQLLNDEKHRRLAVIVARSLGDPVLVPWLFEIMETDELARPAGEAFSFITGLDLAYEDLESDWPEDFEAGPTEDPEDEDVALDQDEDLPWPDPELLTAWWEKNGAQFSPGTRYLRGEPVAEAALQDALKFGKQRERSAAALELALLQPGHPLFETRARGETQQRVLGL